MNTILDNLELEKPSQISPDFDTFFNNTSVKLPDSYKEFLQLSNGGWTTGKDTYGNVSVSVFYSLNNDTKAPFTEGVDLYDVYVNYQIYKPVLPQDWLAIAEDAGGNPICLNVLTEEVAYADHEEEFKLHVICGKFQDFLVNLTEYVDE
jgi:hypothetical protein